ncbi:phospholipase A1-Igamma1, chloroplastic-like [Magnolia sinica]|uniref:phospholipase A1-Igamma1, chloroplastic-like n=1 Tax=Magnolia sinica TaxID=86752 RepID=UPI002658AA1D|nr:phospholipase A1-Igamma1, chloroplastic-like [Magnolia sinica]
MSSPNEYIPAKWHNIHSPSSSTHLIDPPETSAHPSPPVILNSHPSPHTLLSICTSPHIRSQRSPLGRHLPDMNNLIIPMPSPKEDIHAKCQEIHSPSCGTRLVDLPDLWLPQEIVRYGEFTQATTMAFKLESYCGSCQHHLGMLLEEICLNKHGYKVAKFIYAYIDGPSWMRQWAGKKSKDTTLIGYVAFSDNCKSQEIGRRDIAVVWRGTKAFSEWFKDIQIDLVPSGNDADVKVASGFHSIYTSTGNLSSYNQLSASEQVMEAVKGLVKSYKEKVKRWASP